MSINGVGSALNGLTEQIAQSVKNIKAQSVRLPEEGTINQDSSPQTERAQAFALNDYAVSYLSPNSVYSLHKIVSEQAKELTKQKQGTIQSGKEEQENTSQVSEDETLSGLSFSEELGQIFSASDYAKVTAIYRQSYVFNPPDVSLIFQGTITSQNPSQYAADAYLQASELNQSHEPTIELMHKYNQKFDYQI